MHVAFYLAVILFGSSSWLSINAIWMELSQLTQRLPEKWALPSYLDLTIQIACTAPLIVGLVRRLRPKCSSTSFSSFAPFTSQQFAPASILVLLVTSVLFFVILSLFWPTTAYVFGAEHSLGLLSPTFVLALVCALSNVLFMPFMARFHPGYLTAYFVGMGLSALVPSLISLVQGTLQYQCQWNVSTAQYVPMYADPRFSISTFYTLMAAWTVAATIAFVLIAWFPTKLSSATFGGQLQGESGGYQTTVANAVDESLGGNPMSTSSSTRNRGVESPEPQDQLRDELTPIGGSFASLACYRERKESNLAHEVEREKEHERKRVEGQKARRRYVWQMLCLTLACAQMNSIVPNLQIFASLPYSLLTYHLALTLSNAVQPVACFLPLWVMPKRLSTTIALTALSMLVTGGMFVLAAQSPYPLLKRSPNLSWLGGTLAVALSIGAYSICAFLRTLITSLIREEASSGDGAEAEDVSGNRLFWCGVMMQAGSLLGALVMFPVVNVFQVFQQAPPCG